MVVHDRRRSTNAVQRFGRRRMGRRFADADQRHDGRGGIFRQDGREHPVRAPRPAIRGGGARTGARQHDCSDGKRRSPRGQHYAVRKDGHRLRLFQYDGRSVLGDDAGHDGHRAELHAFDVSPRQANRRSDYGQRSGHVQNDVPIHPDRYRRQRLSARIRLYRQGDGGKANARLRLDARERGRSVGQSDDGVYADGRIRRLGGNEGRAHDSRLVRTDGANAVRVRIAGREGRLRLRLLERWLYYDRANGRAEGECVPVEYPV